MVEQSFESESRSGPSRRTVLAATGAVAAVFTAAQISGIAGGSSKAHAAVVWNHPFTVRGRISSPFGRRIPPFPGASDNHKGLDYSPPGAGTFVHSVAAGTVVQAGPNGGLGNSVKIAHADGFASVYGHMQDGSIQVTAGQAIGAGIFIGREGMTGTANGPHLHIEIHLNGIPVDPVNYIHSAPFPGAPGGTQPIRLMKGNMSTLFFTVDASGTLFAFAGDGVGEAAWLETRDQTLANQLASAHHISQSAVHLEAGSFADFKARYRGAAPVSVV